VRPPAVDCSPATTPIKGTSCTGPGYNTCGLRGHKGSEYDGGHRVPFFIRYPKQLSAPRDENTLTANVDFMPTLLDLCGIDVSEYASCAFHGRSLAPLLTDPDVEWPERAVVTDSQRLANPVKWRKSAVMTQRWRLVNGTELYDMDADRGQEHDIHADHPGVVDELRKAYDDWWETVSVQFEEEIPIHIGTDAEKTTCLTGHDWRHPENPWGDTPSNASISHLVYMQDQIRQGMGGIGYHEIQVTTTGTYRFDLRRWPGEDDRPIRDGIPETEKDFYEDGVQEKHHGHYVGGIPMPFTRAGIRIESVSGSCGPREPVTGETVHSSSSPVKDSDRFVRFTAELAEGPHHLTCWFEGDDELLRGAYYVYVSRV